MDTDYSTLISSSEEQSNAQESSVTPELAVPSKKTTSQDKSQPSGETTLSRKSSKTSGQDSTSNAKPYWTEFSEAISSQLLSPTEIGSAGLDLNSLSISSLVGAEKSWFSTSLKVLPNQNSQKISSPFSTSSLVESMVVDATPKSVTRTKKIRVYPNAQQRETLALWFEGQRWFYNQSVEIMETGEFEFTPSFITLYDLARANAVFDRHIPVPYQIKKIACRDAEKAMKAGKKKCKKTGEKFKLHFRSRKAPVQSIFIPKKAVSKHGVYYTMLGDLRSAEPIRTESIGDSRLVLDHGRYFLCVPVKSENQAIQDVRGVVALDSGIRTFQTIFGVRDGMEFIGKFGEQAFERILKLCFRADALISKLKTRKTKQRKSGLKKALARVKWKIWDLIDELHNKVVRFIADNFAVVLLPTFEVSQMVVKSGRKLSSKTARAMLTLSHYKFGQKLELAGVKVYRVNEAYTSKTDSWTGNINDKLGGAKTIKVGEDQTFVDRDVNGARGIFLRAMGDTPELRAILGSVDDQENHYESRS